MHCGPGIDLVMNRNEYHKLSLVSRVLLACKADSPIPFYKSIVCTMSDPLHLTAL